MDVNKLGIKNKLCDTTVNHIQVIQNLKNMAC